MSRYVTKKHGLTIGSDNVFFVANDKAAPEGVPHFRDGYRAIVSIASFEFTMMSTANVHIETPANQLIWRGVRVKTGEVFAGMEMKETRFVLTSFAEGWLAQNVGKKHLDWDVRTLVNNSDRAIFFRRRKDALAFTKMVEQVLAGMKFMD